MTKKRILFILSLSFVIVIMTVVIIYANDLDEKDHKAIKEWYERNHEILINRAIHISVMKYLGWKIIGILVMFASICAGLFDKTFGLIDFTQNEALVTFINTYKEVVVALMVLAFMALGIIYMVVQEKKQLVRNILLTAVVLALSNYAFATANELVTSFKSATLGKSSKSIVYSIVNDNTIDLQAYGVNGSTEYKNLDYSKNKVPKKAGIKNEKSFDSVDPAEPMDYYTENEDKVYGWDNTFKKYMQYMPVNMGDGKVGDKTVEIYNGFWPTDIGNKYYYRYYFDFWSIVLQLSSLVIIYLSLSYKNVRLIYELAIARILAYFYSADVSNGERLKGILAFIRDTYITLCICVISLKIYTIFMEALKTAGITGVAKGVVAVFIAFAVIDGPNIAERITGIDAGLKSSTGRIMAMYGGARATAGMMKRAGTSIVGRKSSTPIPQDGKRHGGIMDKINGASRQRKEVGKKEWESRVGTNASGGKGSSKSTFNASNIGAKYSGTKGTNDSVSSSFNTNANADNVRSNFNASASSSETSGASAGINPDFMNTSPKSRYENPEFKEAVRNMTPSMKNSSAGERRDFHRQVDNIVKGNHQPIKPDKNSRSEYKMRNYKKALKLAEIYKKGGKNGQ